MGRQFRYEAVTAAGGTVGYSLTPYKGVWRVAFIGSDGGYTRVKTKVSADRPETDALREASQAIARAVDRYLRKKAKAAPPPLTWDTLDDELYRRLCSNNNRNKTYTGYASYLRTLASTLPETRGPADITSELADVFKDRYTSTSYKRGKAKDANRFDRGPSAFNAALRHYRAIWNKWIKPRPAINPWLAVDFSEEDDHGPKAPNEKVVDAFMGWLGTRYGKWELPRAFFLVKAVVGCRLLDLCSLKADQFDGKMIVFPASVTKNRSTRRFALPPKVASLLNRVKGTTYLWDAYPAGLAAWLKASRKRAPKMLADFRTSSVYSWAQTEMTDFKAATDLELCTHDFRRRAVTRLYATGRYSVQEIADLFDMTVANLLRSYLDRSEVSLPIERFIQAGADLLPMSA